VITEFVVPEAIDVTAGPDGNIWFTTSSQVGRSTPAGVITLFSTGLGALQGITVGPDGNLWFVSAFPRGQIGNINPSTDHITLFPPLTSGFQPTNITRGPQGDQHLWFTEQSGQIGRIDSLTGHVTFFPVPGVPLDITTRQGYLWFTNETTNAIDRMSLAGTVTAFPIPGKGNAGPLAITAGPANKVLFTDGRNEVGTMTTS
jgi:virginiamycin B lyase